MQTKLFVSFLFFVSLIFVGCSEQKTALTTPNQTQSTPKSEQKTNDLNVSVDFWKKQNDKAREKRSDPVGEKPPGLVVPTELSGGGVTKQTAKMSEMVNNGYKKPLDFADLAELRAKSELVELPIATETYVLDVGGNVTDGEFTTYDFDTNSVVLDPQSSEYLIIKKLADDFDGVKYDLQNASDRKKLKVKLLQMATPQTQKVLEEIAQAYNKEFKMPLRITSLVRSVEYQVSFSKNNANSFVVRDKDSLPPHTSGCAVDIDRKFMTAAEQNFVMNKLAEMENGGKIDALVEYGDVPVFHFFAYWDGKPPKS